MDKFIYLSPKVEILNDSEFSLVEDFTYEWTDKGTNYKIIIPKDFVTDGASIPRFCWSLTGLIPSGVHLGAAVVHDYLYEHRGHLVRGELSFGKSERYDFWIVCASDWNRKECDDMFRRIMTDAGETVWKREAMYWAVRVFGQAAWDR